MDPKVVIKDTNQIPWAAILDLFRRNEWREWYSPEDTQYLLEKALCIASAWDGNKAVGIGVLWGDGRFYTRIDTLLVDEEYRKQGIGTKLVQVLMECVDSLRPHYCELDTHEDWMAKFYQGFGFDITEGPWMDHQPTSQRLSDYVNDQRRRLQDEAQNEVDRP